MPMIWISSAGRQRLKQVAVTSAFIATVSCEAPIGPPDVQGGGRPTSNQVSVPDPSFDDVDSYVPSAAAEREARILAEVSSLIGDPRERKRVLDDLRNPDKTIIEYANPQVAAQISKLYQLRRLAPAARELALSRRRAQTKGVTVTLAIDNTLPKPDRAAVVRLAGFSGHSVVILRREASPGDLALALRVIWELRNREGDLVHAQRRVAVRGKPMQVTGSRADNYRRYLAAMRNGTPNEVAGQGFESTSDIRLGHIRNPRRITP
jgi:hypothetical protein